MAQRRRDQQQWMLDLAVKLTGRVQNFEYDQREVPPGVRSYRMIPRVLQKEADRQASIARAAEEAGHRETAGRLYLRAADLYREAQHAIFADTPYKRHLHRHLLDCHGRAAELSGARVERLAIPWDGPGRIAGLLYLAERQPAPTVLFVPGMDRTKEAYPDPFDNDFTRRGLNVLAIDGPGQGETRLDGAAVTLDNYERAAAAALDHLLERGVVDGGRIAVFGVSMGTYWAARIAAADGRVRAYAGLAGCYGGKWHIFEESSPRFKQVYMYMAGLEDEAAFDAMAAQMTTRGLEERIRCPALVVVGEFDPLSPLEDAYEFYDHLGGPREIWALENEFHTARDLSGLGAVPAYVHVLDWLGDALAGRIPAGHAVERYVTRASALGPHHEPGPRPWVG